MRAVAWYVAGRDLRRERRALAGVALITALAAAVPFTALAAARRTDSALGRAVDRAAIADVGVDLAVSDTALQEQVEALPEVLAVSSYLFVAVRPAGTGLRAGLDVIGIAPLDERATTAMDRPRLTAGRQPRPDRPDEVLVNDALARAVGVGVGDHLTLEAYQQDQVDALFSSTGSVDPSGARLDATVVGIGFPLESVTASGSDALLGVVQLSAAVAPAHGIDHLDFTGDPPSTDIAALRMVLRARLRHGNADAPRFVKDLRSIYGDAIDTTFSEAKPEVFRAASDSTRFESTALYLFALVALLAGVVAAGQAAARRASATAARQVAVLRALGAEESERVLAAVVPLLVAVAAGIAGGVLVAVAASRWFPRGLAAVLEPSPGVRVDVPALGGGALLLFVVVTAWAALAARRATVSRPAVASSVRGGRIGNSPARSLGVRAALRPGRGPAALPVRPTLMAAVLATAGVVGALTFGSSLDHLTSHPRLYGFGWDANVVLETPDEDTITQQRTALRADERVDALSEYERTSLSLDGARPLDGLAVTVVRGGAGPTALAGRLPQSADEIALDPSAVPGPGPHLGDRVEAGAGDSATPLRVVGELTGTGLGAFVVDPRAVHATSADVSDHGFLIDWAPGIDGRAAADALRTSFPEVDEPAPTARIANLHQVRGFPDALAAFLAVLGVLAVGHVLVLAGRRRRGALALLRALGMTGRQVGAVLVWQATTVAVVGIVVGVPLGIAAGLRSWGVLAGSLHVVDQPVVPVLAPAAAMVGALALVNVVALGPSRSARRTSLTDALRTE